MTTLQHKFEHQVLSSFTQPKKELNIIPSRSLYKLWPTKIVPLDNNFFMDICKMHGLASDKEDQMTI
jgi:hypothetical protein